MITSHYKINKYNLIGSNVKNVLQKCERKEQQRRKQLKVSGGGQTGEGIGSMAVRLLRCYAFTDATDTSVVL